jgi:hypothetical protein
MIEHNRQMTTELKTFTKDDLDMIRFANGKYNSNKTLHQRCWDIRESTYVVKAVYNNILKDMTADPTKTSYSYTVSNFRVSEYMKVNEIALPKIASLFPDFQVEGTYTYDGGDPEREKGDPYFDYEVKVSVK